MKKSNTDDMIKQQAATGSQAISSTETSNIKKEDGTKVTRTVVTTRIIRNSEPIAAVASQDRYDMEKQTKAKQKVVGSGAPSHDPMKPPPLPVHVMENHEPELRSTTTSNQHGGTSISSDEKKGRNVRRLPFQRRSVQAKAKNQRAEEASQNASASIEYSSVATPDSNQSNAFNTHSSDSRIENVSHVNADDLSQVTDMNNYNSNINAIPVAQAVVVEDAIVPQENMVFYRNEYAGRNEEHVDGTIPVFQKEQLILGNTVGGSCCQCSFSGLKKKHYVIGGVLVLLVIIGSVVGAVMSSSDSSSNSGSNTSSVVSGKSCTSAATDCESGDVCGLDSFPSTTTVCCPEGTLYDGSLYCKMPGDAACPVDAMCESGACMDFICLSSRLSPSITSFCDSDSDCSNNICARVDYSAGSKQVCCPNGDSSIFVGGDNYCRELFDGSICGSDSMCSSGTCALDYSSGSSSKLCCGVGTEKVYASGNYYCGGQIAGEACGKNEMCASGVCVNGKCLEDPQDNGELCSDNSDCSNNACGKETYNISADDVCCESNSLTSAYLQGDYYYICTGQDDGDLCGGNTMCTNGRCGKSNYTGIAEFICCPSGAYEYAYLGGSSYYFCTFVPCYQMNVSQL